MNRRSPPAAELRGGGLRWRAQAAFAALAVIDDRAQRERCAGNTVRPRIA